MGRRIGNITQQDGSYGDVDGLVEQFTTDNQVTFKRTSRDSLWLQYLAAFGDLDPARDDNMGLAGKTEAEQIAAAKLHFELAGQYEAGRRSGMPFGLRYTRDDFTLALDGGRRIGTASGLLETTHPETFTTDNNQTFTRRQAMTDLGGTVFAYDYSGTASATGCISPGGNSLPLASYGQNKSYTDMIGVRIHNHVEAVGTYQNATSGGTPGAQATPTQETWSFNTGGENGPKYEPFHFVLNKQYLDRLNGYGLQELDWLAFAHQTSFGLDRVRITVNQPGAEEFADAADGAPAGDVHSAYGFVSITNITNSSGEWRGDVKMVSLGLDIDPYTNYPQGLTPGSDNYDNAFTTGDWRDGTPKNYPASYMTANHTNSTTTQVVVKTDVRLEGLSIKILVGAESYDRLQHRVVEHNAWVNSSFNPAILCGEVDCRYEVHHSWPWTGSQTVSDRRDKAYHMYNYCDRPTMVLHTNRDSLVAGKLAGVFDYTGDNSGVITPGYLPKYISVEQGTDNTWYTVFTANRDNQHVEVYFGQSHCYWKKSNTLPTDSTTGWSNANSGNNAHLFLCGRYASSGYGTPWDGGTNGVMSGGRTFGPLNRGEKIYMYFTNSGGAGTIMIHTDEDCDPGVAYYGNDLKAYCKRYVLVRGRYTWDEAKVDAERRGGQLAMIKSQAELDQFKEYTTGLEGENYGTAFIGASDEGSEGTWTWMDGTPVTYANWRAGEPNNGSTGGLTQNYGGIIEGSGTYGTWNGQWDDFTLVNGFGHGNGTCYIMELPVAVSSTFTFITGSFDWLEAKADAESRGGRLACITSACLQQKLEQEYISNIGPFADRHPQGDGTYLTHGFWLGAVSPTPTDITSFTWINGVKCPLSTESGYSNWNVGEPNDGLGGVANGLMIGRFADGKWQDTTEAYGKLGYVLETGY